MMTALEGLERSGDTGYKLAVVVPMYNEEAGARRCVVGICEEFARLDGSWFLVAVDDGSSDGTLRVLKELSRTQEALHVSTMRSNRGYGAALRRGGEEALARGADWLLFMDSDLTNPPKHIGRFAAVIGPDVDFVKATRYRGGGRSEGVPVGRRLISEVGNVVGSWAMGLPLSDVTNGFRAIRAPIFCDMPLHEEGFALIMEEVYWAFRLGLRCIEVPTVLTTRQAGPRGSSFSYSPSVVVAYARYPALALGERLTNFVARRNGRSAARQAPVEDGSL